VTKKKVVKKKATVKKKAPVKKVRPTAKKKLGRPSEYDPAFCDVVIEEMSKGYSKEATAGYLRIAKETFYRWTREHKDFKDAVSIGESLSQRHWENKLVEHVVHTKNGSQINGQVFNLNMKNRFGWTDKNETKTEEVNPKKKTFAFTLDAKPAED
jgi:hypothetical protein